MGNKKERINAAFHYLKENGMIHTQRDLAAAIGSTSPNVSKMLKGDPSALTDNICVRIQRAFGMISANWLIHGEGEMVVMDSNHDTFDNNSMVKEMLAGRDRHIKALGDEIKKLEESHKRELDAKEETIRSLRQQVSDLRFQLAAYRNEKELSEEFHFPPGVAEDRPCPKAK